LVDPFLRLRLAHGRDEERSHPQLIRKEPPNTIWDQSFQARLQPTMRQWQNFSLQSIDPDGLNIEKWRDKVTPIACRVEPSYGSII
jgi:hypothetical protein